MVELKDILVSVIIPVYNVDEYLRSCLESIVSQTHHNIEIILINDGSTDKSPSICNEFKIKDSRIKLINKENGGLSSARNAGLDVCNGDFITFVDSDDWVDKRYVETLLIIAVTKKSDIAFGENELVFFESQIHTNIINPLTTIYSNLEALEALFSKNLVSHTVSWGKLYKKELFIDLRFPTGRIHEDEFTTYILFFKSSRIAYINKRLYFYRQRLNSITSRPHNNDYILAREQQLAFFRQEDIEYISILVLASLCWMILRAFYDAVKKNEINNAKDLLRDLRSHTKDFEFKKIKYNQRLPLAIFATYPNLYLAYRFSKKFFNSSKSK